MTFRTLFVDNERDGTTDEADEVGLSLPMPGGSASSAVVLFPRGLHSFSTNVSA